MTNDDKEEDAIRHQSLKFMIPEEEKRKVKKKKQKLTND